MNIVCDVIRKPEHLGLTRLRAVRPDGTVLIEEMLSSAPHGGYPIYGGPGVGYAIGEYEWQQRIGDDWVTLSRYTVSAS
jgi:hypothetical protein